MEIQKLQEKQETEAINKRKSIERSVQRFAVNTEIENGSWTMRVILQKLIPLPKILFLILLSNLIYL